MQAGWTNLILSMCATRTPVNWWRVGGLCAGLAFSILVWTLLVAALR